MSVEGVGVALDRLQVAVELERRAIEASKEKIKAYQQAMSLLSSDLGSDETTVKKALPRERQRSSSVSAAQTIRRFVTELLLESKRPLNRNEILEEMSLKGIYLNVANPAKRLNKVMWESKEFVHLSKGYWFAEGTPPLTGDPDATEQPRDIRMAG